MPIEQLMERAAKGAHVIRALPPDTRILARSHYDTDGLTAAAVVTMALSRAKKRFRMGISRDQSPEFFRSLAKENPQALIVSDFGSGSVDILESYQVPTIILDHHVPQKDGTDEQLVHVNAHLLGVNGTTEASASTVAFAFAIGMGEENWDLAGIALTGAHGDRQHVPRFSGWNEWVMEGAKKRHHVEEKPGPRLPEIPLVEVLSDSIDPFFRGLAGDRAACQQFLKGLKIDPAKTLGQLDAEQHQKLASALAVHLAKQGSLEESIKEFLGPRLMVSRLALPMEELSDLCNACGREEEPEEGVALLLGDRESLGKARVHAQKYRRKILEGLLMLEKKPPREHDAIRSFEGLEPPYVGQVCGLAMVHLVPKDRPLLGYALDPKDGKLKFSGRGTATLIAKGLNLASAMSEASSRVSGHGGGHAIASGATVPKDQLEEFLGLVDLIVAKQLGGARHG